MCKLKAKAFMLKKKKKHVQSNYAVSNSLIEFITCLSITIPEGATRCRSDTEMI